MDLPYTICFIKKGDTILLLLRNKAPNKGKWNGVGGKIDVNETPYESVLRETWEETGLTIKDLSFRGIVTWNNQSGMYVYVGSETDGSIQEGPEGILEWKMTEWIYQSSDVVSNMAYFLPEILSNKTPMEHAFTYSSSGEISNYQIIELAASLLTFADKEKINN